MRTIIVKAAVLIILILFLYPCSGVQVNFPPDQGPYTGDYVLIQEPGRYTLEENVSHSYPVGVIITSSSVILDGQGYQIHPGETGGPSAGIWITRADKEGNPVTGVKIQNCTISNEVTGIYVEGSDSSEFPWGSRSSDNTNLNGSDSREIKITKVTISGCRKGIASYDGSRLFIGESEFRDNEGGVYMNGGVPDISDLTVTANSDFGISLHNTTGGEISGCRIEANPGAGIILDSVSGLQIWNNILDNPENIQVMNSGGITLNTDLQNQTNIIHGSVMGGNLWAQGGVPIYVSHQITDEDRNGIGDSPYITDSGLEDHYPLIPPGNGFSPVISSGNQEILPEVTPIPTPLSIITGIHGVISGDTIPAEMKSGTTSQAGLTLLNDGTDDWLDNQAVGIRALGDAASWGPEWMAIPSVVSSKQAYTVNFNITAPHDPGTYELSYQAVRGGQGVSVTFGRPYKKVVSVT
jgi:hypothetical protein